MTHAWLASTYSICGLLAYFGILMTAVLAVHQNPPATSDKESRGEQIVLLFMLALVCMVTWPLLLALLLGKTTKDGSLD